MKTVNMELIAELENEYQLLFMLIKGNQIDDNEINVLFTAIGSELAAARKGQ